MPKKPGFGTICSMSTVLHVLSQRPSLTGSGITLDALVRHGRQAGFDQHVVVGVPSDDPSPSIADLGRDRIHPLVFGTGRLPFQLPGMSDVMPYASTVFSAMTEGQIDRYRDAWMDHLQRVIRTVSPALIHSHHLWLVSSLLKDVAPQIPVVTQCHATGFRQMELCPHLAEGVRRGCARNDRFVVLHRGHAEELARKLELSGERVHVVGAGFREELFHARGRKPGSGSQLLYSGKYSVAKGLPNLLDAFDSLVAKDRNVVLHVAGSGSGEEADRLRDRMLSMGPAVVLHGQLSQEELAALMRRCDVCILPSFFEGLPLVLVEAFACGCRLVATALPGIEEQLAPRLGDALELVRPPAMSDVDTPMADELPGFTSRLRLAIEASLEAPPPGDPRERKPDAIRCFGWRAVFDRVEEVWRQLLPGLA
jgi:glycosyltransferase involved in cell wall biosynthesis